MAVTNFSSMVHPQKVLMLPLTVVPSFFTSRTLFMVVLLPAALDCRVMRLMVLPIVPVLKVIVVLALLTL